MSAAAVLLAALVAALAPVALWRPWIGFLAYTWVSFMVPHRLIGGPASDWPFAKVLALATLAGLLCTRRWWPPPRRRELVLLAGLWLVCVASTVFAARLPERAWPSLAGFSKIVLMTVVATMLFRERRTIRAWLWVIALSIGVLAIGGGAAALASGFAELLYGPAGSMIGDNNQLGFVLTIVLPPLAYLHGSAARPWPRRLALATFFAALVAIAATYSRGALIGTAIVVPLVLALAPRRGQLAAAVLLACVSVALLAPDRWFERMATITPTAYRDDASGAQRMRSWYVAARLGLERPLLGGGFRPFTPDLYRRYLPGYSDDHDSHNHFLQVFAEHGVTGLALFAALLGSVVARAWRLARAPHADPERAWIAPLARMLLVSVAAYLVGAAFLNAPYFEPMYQLFAMVIVLGELAAAPAPPVGRSLAALAAARLGGR